MNTKLVQKLLNDAIYIENTMAHETIAKEISAHLRLAASRLEARGEISEAKLQDVALAILNASRKQWGAEPIVWDSPYLTAAHKSMYLELARVAAELTHPMFLRALDTIDAQREHIDHLVQENNDLVKDLQESAR